MLCNLLSLVELENLEYRVKLEFVDQVIVEFQASSFLIEFEFDTTWLNSAHLYPKIKSSYYQENKTNK